MKQCPFCAEQIRDAAVVCKHCVRELDAEAVTQVESSLAKAATTSTSSTPMATVTEIPAALPTIGADRYGIKLGITSDNVLAIRGKSSVTPVQLEADSNGLVVQWIYPGFTYTFRRYAIGGIETYPVSKIERTN